MGLMAVVISDYAFPQSQLERNNPKTANVLGLAKPVPKTINSSKLNGLSEVFHCGTDLA